MGYTGDLEINKIGIGSEHKNTIISTIDDADLEGQYIQTLETLMKLETKNIITGDADGFFEVDFGEEVISFEDFGRLDEELEYTKQLEEDARWDFFNNLGGESASDHIEVISGSGVLDTVLEDYELEGDSGLEEVSDAFDTVGGEFPELEEGDSEIIDDDGEDEFEEEDYEVDEEEEDDYPFHYYEEEDGFYFFGYFRPNRSNADKYIEPWGDYSESGRHQSLLGLVD